VTTGADHMSSETYKRLALSRNSSRYGTMQVFPGSPVVFQVALSGKRIQDGLAEGDKGTEGIDSKLYGNAIASI
jgi:hypothetical protein